MGDMCADYKKEIAQQDVNKNVPETDIQPTQHIPAAKRGFQYLYRGAFAMLKINLKKGERIKAESDAMVAMSPNVRVEGKLEGGVLGGLRRMLSGEKFFFQTLTAKHGPGEVFLSPVIPCEIMDIEMDGSTSYVLQKDGFFAGSEGIAITTKMQNLAKC